MSGRPPIGDADALRAAMEKATARGGKYYKRVPKAGGGYRYFYTKEQYQSAHGEGAHVDGERASKERATTKKVAEIKKQIKQTESEVHNATDDTSRAKAEKKLRGLWRALARTGAGYTRKTAKRIHMKSLSVPTKRFVVDGWQGLKTHLEELEKAGWGAIPGGKKGGQRKRVGMRWVYRYPDGKGGWQSGAARKEAESQKKKKKQSPPKPEPDLLGEIVRVAASLLKPGDVLRPFGDQAFRVIALGQQGRKLHLATLNTETGESVQLVVNPTDQVWVQTVQAQDKADAEAQPPKTPPKTTPRGQADTTTAEMVEESAYVNDRKSNIEQRGEDVLGSARHRAMAWKSLRQALDSEDAPTMFTRKFLEQEEPINFIEQAQSGKNIISVAAFFFSFQKFPTKPPKSEMKPTAVWFFRSVPQSDPDYAMKRAKLRDEWDETRKDPEKWAAWEQEYAKAGYEGYYNAYMQVKAITEAHMKEAGAEMTRGTITDYSQDLRDAIYEARRAKKHPVEIECLRKTYNAVVGRGKASPQGRIREVEKRAVGKAEGVDAKVSLIKDVLMKVMEGQSINAAFGEKGKAKGYQVNLRDMYDTDKMVRRGPKSRYKSIDQGLDLLDANSGKSVYQLRGVQWGKSVTDQERVHHLKSLIDSFDDLAEVTGLPPSMASYNGKLAMAVGARGVAGALAHYEPVDNIINLTRASGAGSLAHEWAHFFDFTAGAVDESTGRNSRNAMTGRAYSRKDTNKNDPMATSSSPTREAVSALRRSAGWKMFHDRLVKKALPTKMFTPKERAYWTSSSEMFARSFERFVQRKLHTQDRENSYLVALRKSASEAEDALWPNNDETDAMTPYFEKVFEAFKTSGLMEKMMRWAEQDRLRKHTVPKRRFVVVP